jgi:GAF domain-containing protein
VYFEDIAHADAADKILAAEPKLRSRLLDEGAASMTIAPITVRENWFGAVVCESNQPNAFDEQFRRFLMAVAHQIAIAVDNRRLFEEARYEARRAQSEAQRALALAEAAQLTNRIGGAGDIAASLNQVFERVAEEVDWIAGCCPRRKTAITVERDYFPNGGRRSDGRPITICRRKSRWSMPPATTAPFW